MSQYHPRLTQFQYKRGGPNTLKYIGVVWSIPLMILGLVVPFMSPVLVGTYTRQAPSFDNFPIVLFLVYLFSTSFLLLHGPLLVQILWIKLLNGHLRLVWVSYSHKLGLLTAYDPALTFSRASIIAFHILPIIGTFAGLGILSALFPYWVIVPAAPAGAMLGLVLAIKLSLALWTLGHSKETVYRETYPGVIVAKHPVMNEQATLSLTNVRA